MSNGLHVVDVLLLGDLRVGGFSARWAAAALAEATERGGTVGLRQVSSHRSAVAPVDPAVRRSDTYHLKNAITGGPADIVFTYGRASDEPLVGDWNGNGQDTMGLRRS